MDFYEFSENVSKNGFIKDLNKLSTKSLFETSTFTQIQQSDWVQNEYGWTTDINKAINDKIVKSLTSYNIWSDYKKINNIRKIKHVKSINSDVVINDPMLESYEFKILNEIFVYLYEQNVKKDISVDRSKFTFDKDFTKSVNKIDSVYYAERFCDMYGTDFPICDYIGKEHKFLIMKMSSFVISDKQALFECGKKFLQDNIEAAKINLMSKVVYGNTEQSKPKSEKFEFRMEFISKNCLQPVTLAHTYQPKMDSSSMWIPLWSLLAKKYIDKKKIRTLKHAWLLKEKNYDFKTAYCRDKIGFLGENEKKFDFEQYWQTSVYEPVREKYLTSYDEKNFENVNDEQELGRFLDDTFSRILDAFAVANLNCFLYNDLVFLDSNKSPFVFLNAQASRDGTVFALCYNQRLIQASPTRWTKILKMFVEKLVQRQVDQVGVLIDYDLHPSLAANCVFQDFFNKFFFVYSLHTVEYIQAHRDYLQTLESVAQEFLNSLKVELRYQDTFEFVDESSVSSTVAKTHKLTNFSKIKLFLQKLSQAPDIDSIRELIKKRERMFEQFMDLIVKDETSHVYEEHVHQIDQDFEDLILMLNIENEHVPIKLTHCSNSFYKSVSVTLYGTSSLWLLIKFGVLFVFYRYEAYFSDLIKQNGEDFDFHYLLAESCNYDSFVEFYTPFAVSILLNRDIVVLSVCENQDGEKFINCLNYKFIKSARGRQHIINMVMKKRDFGNVESNYYAPILPFDEAFEHVDL